MAHMMAETAVVIPARDESADIGAVVAATRRLGLQAIVVDDFSSDDTAAVAKRAGARVLRMPFHAGSWVAMQTGIRAALAEGYQWTVTLDADGQHDPNDIPRLFEYVHDEETSASVVVASCVARGNLRRKLAWRVLRLLSGLGIADLTSGFRLYDRRAMEVLGGGGCTLLEYQDVGVLLHLHRQGLRMVEFEVDMSPRCHGKSKIFRSWWAVGHYLIYSSLVSLTRRSYSRSVAFAGECAG